MLKNLLGGEEVARVDLRLGAGDNGDLLGGQLDTDMIGAVIEQDILRELRFIVDLIQKGDDMGLQSRACAVGDHEFETHGLSL